jgi:hypothetical protein
VRIALRKKSEQTCFHIRHPFRVTAFLQSAFDEKGPAGVGGSGAVRGESLLLDGLKDCCYWWKTV